MNKNLSRRQENIGILDIQAYFPTFYVDQNELEEYDKVGKGKYTIGLGQEKMAFTSDREDINSICLTVLDQLLIRNNLEKSQVGRLEVGTETFLDKSKSVKTYLMTLFKEYNTDIEGVTTSNACYGGTSALFNTINWMQSESWDGRYGIVIMGDIAVYSKGNARPTGGVGSIALLIGPNSNIIIEPIRSTYMNHVYDFYKPDPTKEYPVVDGGFSLNCYMKALHSCFMLQMKKYSNMKMNSSSNKPITSLNDFNYFCFHSPFTKMVEKAFVNLVAYDIIRTKNYNLENDIKSNLFSLFSDSNESLISSILSTNDYNLDNDSHNKLKNILYGRKVLKDNLYPSLYLSKNIGNSYVCSLYMNLLSLLVNPNIDLIEKRIFMFSYGSGCAATLFSLYVKGDYSAIKLRNNDVYENLDKRIKICPKDYETILSKKEKHFLIKDYIPETDVSILREGTYYLSRVDDKWRRYYIKKSFLYQGKELFFNQLSNKKYLNRIVLLKKQLVDFSNIDK